MNFLVLLKKVSLFVVIFCMYPPLYANLISTVYRADARDYTDVFANGFVAWGENLNYYDHIEGRSTETGSHDSAFISTSTSYDFVRRLAFARARAPMQHTYYIYDIRPTDNFYSAMTTMSYLYRLHNTEMRDYAIHELEEEQEYTAYQNITPQQIRSVFIVQYNDNSGYSTMTVSNPNYADEITYANTNPYTGSDGYPLDTQPILFTTPPLVSASFLSDPAEAQTSLHSLPMYAFLWNEL